MVEAVGHVCFSFFSDFRIVSHSPFPYNWQTRFLDSEPIITLFLSNTCGTSGFRMSHNSTTLHPAPCMHVVCCVCGLGLSHTTNCFVSYSFLFFWVEFTNQKKGIYRHCILYPLWLGPLFPNDGTTLKPKVGLGPNQMKIDLRKVFVENITYFWKNKTILGKRGCKIP